MQPFKLNTSLHTYLPVAALALAVSYGGFCPARADAVQPAKAVTVENFPAQQPVIVENFPAQQSVTVENFPDQQAIETGDRPFTRVGTAHIEIDGFSDLVDSFIVPPGMVLELDGASADIHQSITSTGVTVQLRLSIAIPGEAGISVATDQKPVNIQLSSNSYLGNPASWTLPPMHLPPGTSVSVQLIQTKSVFALDYDVLVTGHLLTAIE